MGTSTVKLNGTTLMTVADTTSVAADVAQGKYFYAADGTKTAGTASGGGELTYGTFSATFKDSYVSVLSMELYGSNYYPMEIRIGSGNSNITITGQWIIASDGYMYVVFMSAGDQYWPSVTATSGTVTFAGSQSINSGVSGKSQTFPGRTSVVYKISPNAEISVNHINNN